MPNVPKSGTDTKSPSDSVKTPIESAVETALSLGWQMTRLFGSPECFDTEQKLEEDLPGMSSLAGRSRAELGLAQADGALTTLKAFVGDKVTLPSTKAVRDEISGSAADATALRTAILTLHVDLLVGLTAADFRLGKAYGLGRALADTCVPAHDEPAAELQKSIRYHLDSHRALVLVGWLDDLKTVLPDHAGQSVSDSLQRWIRWWEATALDDADETEIKRVARRLHRQGQRWRAVLSGEKGSKDLLATEDYVDAGRGMLRHARQVVLSFVGQLWAPLAVAGLLLLVGIALMFLDNSTGQVIAGLGTVAGGLGITWRSATNSLGRISHRLGEPLWGAELDRVIADRLTPLPQREFKADPAVPSPGDGNPAA